MPGFGRELTRLLLESGKSEREIARRAGLSHGHVNRLKTASSPPRLKTCKKLVRGLGLDHQVAVDLGWLPESEAGRGVLLLTSAIGGPAQQYCDVVMRRVVAPSLEHFRLQPIARPVSTEIRSLVGEQPTELCIAILHKSDPENWLRVGRLVGSTPLILVHGDTVGDADGEADDFVRIPVDLSDGLLVPDILDRAKKRLPLAIASLLDLPEPETEGSAVVHESIHTAESDPAVTEKKKGVLHD